MANKTIVYMQENPIITLLGAIVLLGLIWLIFFRKKNGNGTTVVTEPGPTDVTQTTLTRSVPINRGINMNGNGGSIATGMGNMQRAGGTGVKAGV